MAEVAKTTEASTDKKVETRQKVFTFKCLTKCYWNGELFRAGDIVKMDSNENVPKHFVLLNK